MHAAAVAAWLRPRRLPCNVEGARRGEEEIGSVTERFSNDTRAAAGDVIVLADAATGRWAPAAHVFAARAPELTVRSVRCGRRAQR